MTKRETRVINAFLNCIRHGDYTEDYAITLIEDEARYGWLSDEAKDCFYEELDKMNEPVEEPTEAPSEEPTEEPVEEEPTEE